MFGFGSLFDDDDDTTIMDAAVVVCVDGNANEFDANNTGATGGILGIVDVAACGPPPNVDKKTFINVIIKMAMTDILLTRSASIISVRFLTLNLN